ncbi:MAG TPA: ATP-binding cassette domain-containing protein [Candidatus Anaerostipes avistercoris]|uniref:ATP-binding cassette domain-containing protein n=1 Tax=Candidatus Anaerostipes avistercoris TaxID=2838462 RepID=A0A9D2PHL7_9FIRM|nr:ATP-binding cassette domain-containing protein [uncultured Anaerostipes sp.]HJC50935.1 ATP-binding cassette domain-containing protein [Candidatus Anaerostipes avistercoris]
MDNVLETRALTKKYKGHSALCGLDMHVPKGSIYGLIGENGAGKTTLIRLICGLQNPDSGQYYLYGRESREKDIYESRRRMGAVVETPSLYLDMTARDNLVQQSMLLGRPSCDGMDDLLELVGLGGTGKKKAKDFSLGMRQRLGFGFLFLSIYIFSELAQPEMIQQYVQTSGGGITEWVKNPAYVDGTKREIYEWLLDVIPTGQAMQVTSSAHRWLRMMACSLGTAVVCSCVGICCFRRRNIK